MGWYEVVQKHTEELKKRDDRIAKLMEEKNDLAQERAVLVGFLAGAITIACNDLDEPMEIAEAIASPVDTPVHKAAVQKWNKLNRQLIGEQKLLDAVLRTKDDLPS